MILSIASWALASGSHVTQSADVKVKLKVEDIIELRMPEKSIDFNGLVFHDDGGVMSNLSGFRVGRRYASESNPLNFTLKISQQNQTEGGFGLTDGNKSVPMNISIDDGTKRVNMTKDIATTFITKVDMSEESNNNMAVRYQVRNQHYKVAEKGTYKNTFTFTVAAK